MSKSKSKYYVVWVGVTPGIYTDWKTCQTQISGFPAARYKSFKTKAEAERAFKESAEDHIGQANSVQSEKKNHKSKADPSHKDIIMESICVDAACSGNPGELEYRGVVTSTGKELFHVGPLSEGTNNVGEFLALVHGIAYLIKNNREDLVIYTDSKTAMAWLRNKALKSTLKKTEANKKIFNLIDRALGWLEVNEYDIKIIKWKTAEWGEIPADFGRK